MNRTKKVLRRLRYVAENVIDYRRVKMGSWFQHGSDVKPTPHLQKDGTPDPHGCGTTACFLGWAITGDKRFRKLTGLSMKWIWNRYQPRPQGMQYVHEALGIGEVAFGYLFDEDKSGKKRHLLARLKEVEKDPFAWSYPEKK